MDFRGAGDPLFFFGPLRGAANPSSSARGGGGVDPKILENRKGVLELPLRISSDSPAAPPALNSWVRLGEGRPAGQCYGGAPWESFGGMIIGCPDSSGRFSKSFFRTITENINHLQMKSGPTRPLQPHYPHAGCRGVREEVIKKPTTTSPPG